MNRVKPKITFTKETDEYGQLIFEPLLPGMGTTIGNSIRRVLLSSLSGSAITHVKIDGIRHEFETMEHVVEDILDILANIKGVVFRSESTEVKELTINFKGKGSITAADIKHDAEVEIVNKDHHIAEVTKSRDVKISLFLEQGFGYSPSEKHKQENDSLETIYLDASFSPIVRVNPNIDKVRVGRDLGYDKLSLEVWTNGSRTAEQSIKAATEILMQHFFEISALDKIPQFEDIEEEVEEEEKPSEIMSASIDDLELSARSLNCLKKAGVETVKDLIEKKYEDLVQIKNFGKKSADEINEKLVQYGLSIRAEEELCSG